MGGRSWTAAEDRYLRDAYAEHSAIEIARRLARSPRAVRIRAHRLYIAGEKELFWTDAELAYLERSYDFEEITLIAKRLKRSPSAVSSKAFELGLARGRRGYKVGTIVHRVGDRVPRIKVREPNQWEQLPRYMWAQLNGPIPEGAVITLIDGDPANCEPANLMCTTRGELIKKNAPTNYPAEIRRLIQAAKQLKAAIDDHN